MTRIIEEEKIFFEVLIDYTIHLLREMKKEESGWENMNLADAHKIIDKFMRERGLIDTREENL